MKKIIIFSAFFLFLFLTACSGSGDQAEERLKTYVKQWNNGKFEAMYEMLSKEAKEQYPADQFVDRYEKIYKDLGIEKIKVDFTELDNDKKKTAKEKGTITIPITVEMGSIAGPIAFDYETTLVEEGERKDKDWFIRWDAGLIFPELKDGGKINIKSEAARRGEILDRNKMPLAINDTVWEVGIVPGNLGSDAEQTKKKAAELLHMSVESIDKQLDADWVEPNLFVPLKKVPKTDEKLLNKLWDLDGVQGNEAVGRTYPLNKAASHLVGYIGKITAEEMEKQDPGAYSADDMIGKRGLEQLFESKLRGEKGVAIVIEKEDEDDIVIAEKEVKDGENIELTIDANIQDEIYQSYKGAAGTAAAIDPQTGETLALVSSPGFNPDTFLSGISQKELEKLQDDKQTPLLNRSKATYAPGSVMKPITAAIGLKNGTIKPDEGIEINGLTWSNGKGWGDYKVRRVSESDGPVDLNDALVRSDNIYFAMKAIEMGDKAYIDGLKEFGFGEDFPFTYPLTKSTISSNGKLDNEVLLANTSYGQGEIELSALHMAASYTPFLHKGDLLKPTLLLSEDTEQVWKKDLLTEEQADIIQKALRQVVTKGTGKKANIDDLAISGKTGTAELKLTSDEKGQENGWFVGYPTDDQDIIIALMMEQVEKQGGSSVTTEQVADILQTLKK
jgi:penicillin-binding protein